VCFGPPLLCSDLFYFDAAETPGPSFASEPAKVVPKVLGSASTAERGTVSRLHLFARHPAQRFDAAMPTLPALCPRALPFSILEGQNGLIFRPIDDLKKHSAL
jgi:hypothetical protein